MKKMLQCVVLMIALILLLCGFGTLLLSYADTENRSADTTEKFVNTEIISQSSDNAGKLLTTPDSMEECGKKPADTRNEIIIADDDLITATFEKLYDGKALGVENYFYINISVRNKGDRDIWVYLDRASVNDEMIPLVLNGLPLVIKPQKLGRNVFGFPNSMLSISNVDEIKNITFDLVIADEETLNEIERFKDIILDF